MFTMILVWCLYITTALLILSLIALPFLIFIDIYDPFKKAKQENKLIDSFFDGKEIVFEDLIIHMNDWILEDSTFISRNISIPLSEVAIYHIEKEINQ